ncbi:MAG: DUF4037 domain-containing protein [Lachnospiraceae bacterium]|nr:DUF4037 domain-containing protein [Lachnospiraceae bacterium]
MTGLEIARGYFEEYGRPMLEREFPEVLPQLAAGLCGSGSECFGYDDDISRDHDFAPGFLLFLPGEDAVDRRTAFLLERAYAKLPKSYGGAERSLVGAVGGMRRGVVRTADFFMEKTGTPDGRLSLSQWLTTPQSVLAEAVNGQIFFDGRGDVTQIRARLADMPEDVRRKRLAGHLLLMGQAGQYNYQRCLAHGEEAAAQLAAIRYVQSLMEVCALLSRRYLPYYKWSFRAMRELPVLSDQAAVAEYLLTTPNDPNSAEDKYFMIEDSAKTVIDELMRQDLTRAICLDLEKHAYSVNDSIADADLRNLHVLAAV